MKRTKGALVWLAIAMGAYWATGALLFARSAGFGVIVPAGSVKAGVVALVVARLVVKLIVVFVIPGIVAWRLGRRGAAWLSSKLGG